MYAELHCLSNFSFLRGASHPEELVEQAAALGLHAIAITDINSLAGIVRAHQAAKNAGIQFIIGCALELQESLTAPDRPPHCTVLAFPTTFTAYSALCTLLTRGRRRAPKGSCYLTLDDLEILSTDTMIVAVSSSINADTADTVFRALLRIFSTDQLSISISRLYEHSDRTCFRHAIEWASTYSIPLVATNEVHYHIPARRKLQDALTCIRTGTTIDTAGYELFSNGERYLKPPREMQRLFRAHPQAIHRGREIAEHAAGCSLDQLHYDYPEEICPDKRSPQQYLAELTWQGAATKYPHGVPPAVRQHIEHELTLIEELGYAKYFLTVYDIVSFARSQHILCQGRGAAANSAVCFCLGITSVDPDKISILFERFISKERNEPPDIDIDFEHERREEVLQYVYNKYGRDRAALVAAVITYRGRSAVREIGKALGLSLDCVDRLAKSLNKWTGTRLNATHLTEAGLDPN
ncbi:MAG: PHP domain-containing protein, partial [Bdellovibrionales bacterium]|nr:PHP domain-containing protein [Bdellovibrionales bacterium]